MTRFVESTDGVRLAVYESDLPAPPDAPTIVAIHGYPDNHSVWDGVVAVLSDRFRVVTYDVRGAGASDKPAGRRAFRMDQLVDDLGAVLDAVSPDAPVHLLGHDWGSIQAWPAITDARFADRIATFTSVSGPSLDHAGAWLRRGYQHPRAAARQLLESFYIAAFQLPALPERVVRSSAFSRAITGAAARGRSANGTGELGTRSEADRVNGIQLYRANMSQRLSRPVPLGTAIPVQVLAPRQDAFVSAPLQTQAPVPFVPNLVTHTISGGHWVVLDRPDVIARFVEQFVTAQGTASSSTRRPRSGRFADQLVVITGGGRGIGRACALEFAREGADVVVADIDDAAAKETVERVETLGVAAWAYHLDVADADAWETFAAQLRAEHRVPDVIVNNAGIGMGGPFLATSVADWQRILDVNVWGVIHGSRVFGAQLVERGQGGQIVNIASAAAYSPSKIYPAYATTKAAVLMLTECLRAELAGDGIGVTAICPGFVDTDISRTTVHVGVDDAEQERRRDHAVAAYKRRNYTPERLAKHAVRAASRNTPVAPISAEAKALRAITRFAPALGRQLAKVDLNKL